MADHYETLGIGRDATGPEIRRAFGRLAKELHPDRNSSEDATARFLRVKEAYDVLADPDSRRNYDAVLNLEDQLVQRRQKEERERIQRERAARSSSQVNVEEREKAAWLAQKERIDRLGKLMNSSRFADAEVVAGEVLLVDSRNAVAYAALGDICRVRGDLAGAQKHYAFAAQFDSRNPVYQRKYEEILLVADRPGSESVQELGDIKAGQAFVVIFVVLAGLAYSVLAREAPLFPGLWMGGTLTVGLLVMLFVAGLALGASLTAANAMDPIDSSLGGAVVKVPPAVVLGFVALINFWLAVGLYVLIGTTQGAFSRSLTRLISFSAVVLGVFVLGRLSVSGLAAVQALFWGGNLVYLGAASGWYVADSLRRI